MEKREFSMKKLLLLLCVVACNMQAMEKNEPVFPYDQLPLDVQGEVLTSIVNLVVVNAQNPDDAVAAFVAALNELRVVNKHFNQFANKAAIYMFLNAAVKKFPGYEVRLARALDNEYAALWLKSVKPQLKKYKPSYPDMQNLFMATTLIKKNQLNLLEDWLNSGYDPDAQATEGTLLFIAITAGNLEAVTLLVRYGADFNSGVKEFPYDTYTRTPLQLLQTYINLFQAESEKYIAIDNYLRLQGARD